MNFTGAKGVCWGLRPLNDYRVKTKEDLDRYLQFLKMVGDEA